MFHFQISAARRIASINSITLMTWVGLKDASKAGSGPLSAGAALGDGSCGSCRRRFWRQTMAAVMARVSRGCGGIFRCCDPLIWRRAPHGGLYEGQERFPVRDRLVTCAATEPSELERSRPFAPSVPHLTHRQYCVRLTFSLSLKILSPPAHDGAPGHEPAVEAAQAGRLQGGGRGRGLRRAARRERGPFGAARARRERPRERTFWIERTA